MGEMTCNDGIRFVPCWDKDSDPVDVRTSARRDTARSKVLIGRVFSIYFNALRKVSRVVCATIWHANPLFSFPQSLSSSFSFCSLPKIKSEEDWQEIESNYFWNIVANDISRLRNNDVLICNFDLLYPFSGSKFRTSSTMASAGCFHGSEATRMKLGSTFWHGSLAYLSDVVVGRLRAIIYASFELVMQHFWASLLWWNRSSNKEETTPSCYQCNDTALMHRIYTFRCK